MTIAGLSSWTGEKSSKGQMSGKVRSLGVTVLGRSRLLPARPPAKGMEDARLETSRAEGALDDPVIASRAFAGTTPSRTSCLASAEFMGVIQRGQITLTAKLRHRGPGQSHWPSLTRSLIRAQGGEAPEPQGSLGRRQPTGPRGQRGHRHQPKQLPTGISS
jgi:hypothetical protein